MAESEMKAYHRRMSKASMAIAAISKIENNRHMAVGEKLWQPKKIMQ